MLNCLLTGTEDGIGDRSGGVQCHSHTPHALLSSWRGAIQVSMCGI